MIDNQQNQNQNPNMGMNIQGVRVQGSSGSIPVGFYDPRGLLELRKVLDSVIADNGWNKIVKKTEEKEKKEEKQQQEQEKKDEKQHKESIELLNKITEAIYKQGSKLSPEQVAFRASLPEIGKGASKVSKAGDNVLRGASKVSLSAQYAYDIVVGISKTVSTWMRVTKNVVERQLAFKDMYSSLETSGIRLQGGIDQLWKSADYAGLKVNDFANILTQNARQVNRLSYMGYDGVKVFTTALGQFKDGKLGVSIQTAGKALSKFADYANYQDLSMTPDMLITNTERYIKQLKELSQVTGKTVDQLIEEQNLRQKSLTIRALMKNPLYADKLNKLLSAGFSEEVAIATVTGQPNKEMAMLGAQNPALVIALQDYARGVPGSEQRVRRAGQSSPILNAISRGSLYYGAIGSEAFKTTAETDFAASQFGIILNKIGGKSAEVGERVSELTKLDAIMNQYANAQNNLYQINTDRLTDFAASIRAATNAMNLFKENLGDMGSYQRWWESGKDFFGGLAGGMVLGAGMKGARTVTNIANLSGGMVSTPLLIKGTGGAVGGIGGALYGISTADTRNEAIGGGIGGAAGGLYGGIKGAALGFAVGGPIGALIGGSIGGTAGGWLGSKVGQTAGGLFDEKNNSEIVTVGNNADGSPAVNVVNQSSMEIEDVLKTDIVPNLKIIADNLKVKGLNDMGTNLAT